MRATFIASIVHTQNGDTQVLVSDQDRRRGEGGGTGTGTVDAFL